jgi:hypothetical protein
LGINCDFPDSKTTAVPLGSDILKNFWHEDQINRKRKLYHALRPSYTHLISK